MKTNTETKTPRRATQLASHLFTVLAFAFVCAFLIHNGVTHKEWWRVLLGACLGVWVLTTLVKALADFQQDQ